MKKEKTIIVRDFFNPPIFDFYFKWKAITINKIDLYEQGGDNPTERTTRVIWRSLRTGRISKKIYKYQI